MLNEEKSAVYCNIDVSMMLFVMLNTIISTEEFD
jgi:hypothetical protein